MTTRTVGRYMAVAVVVLTPALAAGVARTMGVRPVRIVSNSMAPTVEAGEWIVVRDLDDGPGPASIHRGDVVLFEYPEGSARYALKRVLALPGDRVTVTADSITVNGQRRPLAIAAGTPTPARERVDQVPADTVYLVGDNSAHSIDSRTLGPVSDDRLIAEAFYIAGTTTDLARRATAATVVITSGLAFAAVRQRRRSPDADPTTSWASR